jgi:hypothetical protein
MEGQFKLNLGFRFFQHSNTPVLQNCSPPVPAKQLNSDLALRTKFAMLNKLLPFANLIFIFSPIISN